MDPKDRTLESMNMFGKRNPSQLLSLSSKRPRISTGAESDEIDLDDEADSDLEVLDNPETQGQNQGGPSVDATVVIEESEVNLKSVKRLRLLAERGGDLGRETCPAKASSGPSLTLVERPQRDLSKPQVCGFDPGYDIGFGTTRNQAVLLVL